MSVENVDGLMEIQQGQYAMHLPRAQPKEPVGLGKGSAFL